MIKIQQKDFSVDEEILTIKNNLPEVGSVSTFIGYVRNLNDNKKVNSIELEVYEEMAYKSLEAIIEKSLQRWSLIDALVIHRYGKLKIGEKIVLVATFSKKRNNSQEACKFIMDYLKKESPFWKKENYPDGYKWLENISSKS